MLLSRFGFTGVKGVPMCSIEIKYYMAKNTSNQDSCTLICSTLQVCLQTYSSVHNLYLNQTSQS